MKAAVHDLAGDPTVLQYRDVPDPVIRADQVLIAVEAIAIEGGDLINRRTATPPARSWVPGYAAAGTIVAVGSGVDCRRIGDRVAAFDMQGSHAERWAVPAVRTWLIPECVEAAEAAVLPISFGTAHHALFARGGLGRGETVLIQAAAGGVGVAAVQLAARAGATVLAVSSGRSRLEKILALGAYHVMDRTSQDVAREVRRVTGGNGADLVIDPVGSTLPSSLAALAPEGRLVFVGNAGGGPLHVDLWPPMQSNQTLLGVFMGPMLERPAVRATIDELLRLLASKRIQVAIDRTFPLSEAAAAHHWAESRTPFGRVVMRP